MPEHMHQHETTYQVKVLTDSSAFTALQEEWEDLRRRSPHATVYTSWAWLHGWWRVYGADKELRLITLRQAETGQLVGLAPLMRGKRVRGRKRLQRDILALIGTGEGPQAEGLDLLADAACLPQAVAAIWRACTELRSEWQQLQFDDLRHGQTGFDLLVEQALQEPYLALFETQRRSLIGQLPDSFEGYVAQLPSKEWRKLVRRYMKRMGPEGRFTPISCTTGLDRDTLEHWVGFLARHSIEIQRRKGQTSAWADHRFRACMVSIIALLAERNEVWLHALRAGDRDVAVRIGFVTRDTYEAYQSAYDVEFAEDSPGHCLRLLSIKEAIEGGLSAFNMGSADYAYKSRYFPDTQPVGTLTIVPADAEGRSRLGGELLQRGWRQRVKSWLRR